LLKKLPFGTKGKKFTKIDIYAITNKSLWLLTVSKIIMKKLN
tara:strand:- start:195 stop:320 length:126 start_codon:yes stop_codon:yes gene_type:complete